MNNELIIDERQRELGDFIVGRLLPFRKKRAVGPFIFIDHMGPDDIGPGHYLDVDQHPHIGLSTLTYLLEGQIEHRDSMGEVRVVNQGDVGFMTSGSGVTHTERTPASQRDGQIRRMHGYQIWVGLPKEKESMEPEFDFVKSEQLPKWEENGIKYVLAAGKAMGHESPLKVHSPLYLLDMQCTKKSELDLRDRLYGEIAIVVTQGEISHHGESVGQGQMLVNVVEDSCSIEVSKGSRLLIFGGNAFPEERYLLWNFASSDKAILQKAKSDWEARNFPKVPGDNTYIPFP